MSGVKLCALFHRATAQGGESLVGGTYRQVRDQGCQNRQDCGGGIRSVGSGPAPLMWWSVREPRVDSVRLSEDFLVCQQTAFLPTEFLIVISRSPELSAMLTQVWYKEYG